jgi:endonuclease/exonuclease/phosphatase family metal-dependent hydrolase
VKLLLALVAVPLVLLALLAPVSSRPGREPEGCLDGCARPSTRQPGPLRVLSLNVLHGFPIFAHVEERMALIADEIERSDADVICLQEVPTVVGLVNGAEWLAERTQRNHVFFRANGNRNTIGFEEGAAILTRFPIIHAAGTELVPRAPIFEHRIVLHARVAAPGGAIDVFSTHLAIDAERNRGQTRDLVRVVEENAIGAVIVAGDFNAEETSPQIADLAALWTDTFRALQPESPGATCCSGVLRGAPRRIDYVFAGPGLVPLSSRVILEAAIETPAGALHASDHSGLFVELER